MKNDANTLLEIHLKELGYGFSREFPFHPKRKWRFDYLIWLHMFTAPNTAIEIEGGIWVKGRHNRPGGFQKDLEKYREATRLGYKVYRFATQEVLNGTARQFLAELTQPTPVYHSEEK